MLLVVKNKRTGISQKLMTKEKREVISENKEQQNTFKMQSFKHKKQNLPGASGEIGLHVNRNKNICSFFICVITVPEASPDDLGIIKTDC